MIHDVVEQRQLLFGKLLDAASKKIGHLPQHFRPFSGRAAFQRQFKFVNDGAEHGHDGLLGTPSGFPAAFWRLAPDRSMLASLYNYSLKAPAARTRAPACRLRDC
jgi:hypothetical protein